MAKRKILQGGKTVRVFVVTALLGFTIVLAIYALRSRSSKAPTIEGFAHAEPSRLCNNTYYFEIPGFLTPDECDAVRAAAVEQGMEESKVGEKDSFLDTNVRMSTQTWLKHDDSDITKKVTKKTVALVRDMEAKGCFKDMGPGQEGASVSVDKHFEDIQVVRYGSMGKYDPHYDGEECGDEGQPECASNQRVATILMYLNDDFEGGETRFPNLNIKVKPQKGKAVFFWVSDPITGYVFKNTLHGGDPVQHGEKWIATQWIRRSKGEDA